MIIGYLKGENNSLNKDYKKTKFIRCFNCGRFCKNNNINNLEQLAINSRKEGFDNIVFCCERGVNGLKELIDNNKNIFNIINIKIKHNNGQIILK